MMKYLQFIFMPSFWLMNYPYSKQWDAELNNLMSCYEPIPSRPNSIDGHIHTVTFGFTEVWIRGYPYAYGCNNNGKKIYRPSRLTILNLKKLLKEKGIE